MIYIYFLQGRQPAAENLSAYQVPVVRMRGVYVPLQDGHGGEGAAAVAGDVGLPGHEAAGQPARLAGAGQAGAQQGRRQRAGLVQGADCS